ncbi:3-oxoacyl-ACP synthase III family protein [Cesiribacter andamanensis]|uniref:3-oxoacyl-[acyl-carrier-protein] synthase 3 n=1 Tax=Cesiribacter andamanensis AMV16 TaxID=1279009 RepID=M7N088_9BACT|nr:ketoacyl-ACP synthase III [Cesiribacter andamanensis]EMR02113.1 3-oxoacyl-[acyl-carrier-protein] synthase 3 [Cesiribacter andamanensis AMV16]
MRNAVILSSGAYAPENIVPNTYFNELLGEDVDSWLRQNVHIWERRWASEDQSTSDLVLKAAATALERAGVAASELDLIIVATDTPEYVSPSTASKVQYLLGAGRAGTFDLNTACAGFVTALDVGSKYIRADAQYNKVLVVGAYLMSKYLDKLDKKTANLFADGAGAVVLGAEEGGSRGFLASQLRTQGQYHDWMGIYAGGTFQPVTEEVVAKKDHLLKFVKRFPSELNPNMWSEMILQLCQRIGVDIQEVDHIFFTQININAIWATLELLGLPRERAHTIMHHYGYTGSACIPMALDEALQLGKVKAGDLVIFMGSGGGLSFACAAFRL